MKKITLIAAAALTAVAANAQYAVNPETSVVAAQNPSSVQYIALSEESVKDLEAKGAKVTYIGANDDTCWLYIWEGTMVGGDSSYPGVDGPGEYPSFNVTNVGWSGAGYCFTAPYDLSSWNDETRFHIAYMTSGNAPASIALLISNDDLAGNAQGKIAVGTAFDDNGTIIPSVGPAANDDWQGIDISFADLKKLWPAFSYGNMSAMTGNIFSFLAGGVEGTSFAFDTLYFYNPGNGSNVEPEEPGTDEPGDQPGEEEPGDDQPGDDQPGDDQPGDDQPGDDQPGDDQPGDDQPGDDQPGDDEPGDDEPGDDQPGTEDPDDTGVESIAAEGLGFVVTKHTVNLNGANGMVLYDLAGKVVKSTSGCVLGIDNLPKGVYVVKSGKLVRKVVVR